jgi:hypothetical protein
MVTGSLIMSIFLMSSSMYQATELVNENETPPTTI